MSKMLAYKGYLITVAFEGERSVRVFDPRCPREPAFYKTGSLETAKKWISAYRKGEYWATAELELQRRHD